MGIKLIPERLLAARKAAGISQTALCKIININQGAYSHYEGGTRSPNPHTIDHLALCLGTSTEYLTGESNDPSPATLMVSKKDEPEIYDLVQAVRNNDSKQVERLLKYYVGMTKAKK